MNFDNFSALAKDIIKTTSTIKDSLNVIYVYEHLVAEYSLYTSLKLMNYIDKSGNFDLIIVCIKEEYKEDINEYILISKYKKIDGKFKYIATVRFPSELI